MSDQLLCRLRALQSIEEERSSNAPCGAVIECANIILRLTDHLVDVSYTGLSQPPESSHSTGRNAAAPEPPPSGIINKNWEYPTNGDV